MTVTRTERLEAAYLERKDLLAQALRNHMDSVNAEVARYGRELDHINSVYKLRLDGAFEEDQS